MDVLDFDGDMWDPEYCDSELRAVEASGESRDELCLYRQTQLKLNRRLTGGNVTRVTVAWQWPIIDAMDKKCCWDYPSIMLDFIQTSDVLPNSTLYPCYLFSWERAFNCIACFVIQQPTMFTI